MQSIEQARSYLSKADTRGRSLYDHLVSVVLKILQDKPEDPLATFETLSSHVKELALHQQAYSGISAMSQDIDQKNQLINYLSQSDKLFHQPDLEVEDVKLSCQLPDIISQCELLKWAGVGFPEEEIYKIALAIQQFVLKYHCSDVRFFGKILGQQNDYYIIEAKMPISEDEKLFEKEQESHGTGCNRFSYYVTNHLEDEWTLLPHVSPSQIILSRSIRKFFTGNLNAPVPGHPRFPFPESHLLRAVISRIAHNTLASPKGFFHANENDEEDVVIDDDYHPIDLLSLENWVHYRPYILKNGRCSAFVNEEDDADDDKVVDAETETGLPMFTPIISDTVEHSDISSLWSVRQYPSVALFPSVYTIRSIQWPGAVNVTKNQALTSLYYGYGLPLMVKPYTPLLPIIVQNEYQHTEEEPLIEQTDPLIPSDLPTETKDDDEEEILDDDNDKEDED